MFNIGGGELIVIMLIALIVLGPQRLPDAARQVGKALSDLRRLSTGFQNEVRTALDTADDPNRVAARRNLLAKEATPETTVDDAAEPGAEPTEPTEPQTAPPPPVRTEPLVAGPPMEPRNGAATPPRRPSAQARAAAKRAAGSEDAAATNGTPVKTTKDASTASPTDEASTGPTKA